MPVTREVACECGFAARAEAGDALVERVRGHMAAAHGFRPTAAQVMAMARPVMDENRGTA